MKKRNTFFLIAIGFTAISFLTSCGGGSDTKKTDETQVAEQVAPAVPSAEQMAAGEKIFNEKCKACHQADGNGIANVFPTLKGSNFLLTKTKLAVEQVLNGSAAVVADRTVKYPAPMPPQVSTHEDAVNVINYVLNSFGNKGGMITVDEVKDIVINPR